MSSQEQSNLLNFPSVGPNSITEAIAKQQHHQQQQQQQQQRNAAMLQASAAAAAAATPAASNSPAGFSPSSSASTPTQRRNVRSRRNSTANDAATPGLKTTREISGSRPAEKSKLADNCLQEKQESRKGNCSTLSIESLCQATETNSLLCYS